MVPGGNELEGVVVVLGVRLGGGVVLLVDQYHIFHTTGRTTTISRFVYFTIPDIERMNENQSHRALI
jgi:hypothetical protein